MASRTTTVLPDAATAFVALSWMGMLAGVSFLATPVKFKAASLVLPVALEVGHVTFAAFSKVELILAVLLGIAALSRRMIRVEVLFAAVAVAIVAVQALWLLPTLDARIEAVIAGEPMPASMHHKLYAALEASKAAALAIVGLLALFRLGRHGRSEIVAE